MAEKDIIISKIIGCLQNNPSLDEIELFLDNWRLSESEGDLIVEFLESSDNLILFNPGSNEALHNIITDLLTDLDQLFRKFILQFIYNLTLISPINKQRAHSLSLSQLLLDYILVNPNPLVKSLFLSLVEFGLSYDQFRQLYKYGSESEEIFDIMVDLFELYPQLVQSLIMTNESQINFNSLTMNNITKGFTIQSWLKLNPGVSNLHQGSDSGFNFITLSNDKEKPIVQYSIKQQKIVIETMNPSSKYYELQTFESFNFELGKLYNVALLHKYENRKNSRVDLFVNGEFIQTVSINYPFSYLHETLNTLSLFQSKLATQNNTHRNVKVHLNINGSSYMDNVMPEIVNLLLISTVPSLEWILMSYYLGPSYDEDYQDSNLIRFLNPRSRIQMQLKLQENIETSNSDFISKELKNKQINGNNETDILELSKFNLSAHSVSLNFHASNTESNKNLTIYNNAPSATKVRFKYEIKSNDDIIHWNPNLLINTLYTIGGFAIPLRFIEIAKTTSSLVKSLDMLFYVLSNDFRSLEEFESKAGYDILATVLKTKKNLIKLEVLDSILKFIGYNYNSPIDSILANSIAYKSLVVDFEIWKPNLVNGSIDSSSKDTFKFVLFQFTVFGQDSKYHTYNIKELIKIRIIKRFIQALKYELFEEDILTILHDSLLILIKLNPTPEVLRSLSLYIVYALNKDNSELQRQCGITALEILVSVICEPPMNSQSYKKILKCITIRWVLLLLDDPSPKVIKLALRLLIKVLILSGGKDYRSFIDSIGLSILTQSLKKWWADNEILVILFSAIFGISYSNHLVGGSPNDFSNWVQKLSTKGSRISLIMPEFLLVVNNIIKFSIDQLKDLIKNNEIADVNEVALNVVSLLNSFINSMVISNEKIKCLNNFFSSDSKWLLDMLQINLKLKQLQLISKNDLRIAGINSLYSNFVSNIFIEKLFTINDPNRLKSLNLMETISNQSTISFNVVVIPNLVDHLKNFESTLPSLIKDSVFIHSIIKLLNKSLDSRMLYKFENEEFISIIEGACLILNIVESGNLAIMSNSNYKTLKKEFGTSFLQFFVRCTESELIKPNESIEELKFCCSTLMMNQILIIKSLNDENLATLISLLFKNLMTLNPEITTLSINCMRIFIMNSIDLSSVATVLTKDKATRLKFTKLFQRTLNMNDEEIKLELYSDPELKDCLNKRFNHGVSILENIDDKSNKLSKIQIINEIIEKQYVELNAYYLKIYNKEILPSIKLIVNSETKKFNRHIQDDKDDLNYYISIYNSIKDNLPIEEFTKRWYLDSTEGPERMRKRIVNEVHSEDTPKIDDSLKSNQSEEMDDNNLEASLEEEDRNRKILRNLFIGDKIIEIFNVTQILGLETVESILIVGLTHLYLTENYFRTLKGEIVNVDDAPESERDPYVKLISGSNNHGANANVSSGNFSHKTKTWEISELASISKRNFLLRDVSIELFFIDGTSFLITCLNKATRDSIFSQLSNKITAKISDESLDEALKLASKTKDGVIGSKLFSVLTSSSALNLSFSTITRKWKKGEISNFYYLILVNTMAGRTFNDLTQYPIFPFVLSDYESEELDLDDPKSYRDLSKPMGAQNEKRANQFRERYEASIEMSPDSPPFHYGTHYSSAMIVSSYLIRLEPFVQSYLLLQGGKFDHADRLFYSISKLWSSASRDNTTDVRELIPEFYYLPDFLLNKNNFKFGTLQNDSKSEISDVVLPPWSKNDPILFVSKMRQALESDHVSRNLHKWIDLIFGFKQTGEKAIESLNVFHHLSYTGSINLDNVEDEHEKNVVVSIIHNFGQTPLKIFSSPHPEKTVVVSSSAAQEPINPNSLFNLAIGVIDVHDYIDLIQFDKLRNQWVTFNKFDRSSDHLRIKIVSFKSISINDRLIELVSNSKIAKVEIISSSQFLICFEDGLIQLIKLINSKLSVLKNSQRSNIKSNNVSNNVSPSQSFSTSSGLPSAHHRSLELEKTILRGNNSSIKSIKFSKKHKSILSLNSNGEIKLWNQLTGLLIKSIKHTEIKLIAMSDDTGSIAIVDSSDQLKLLNINGDLILDCPDSLLQIPDSSVTCIELSSHEHGGRATNDFLVVGYDNGLVKLLELHLNEVWELKLVKDLDCQLIGNEITSLKFNVNVELNGSGNKIHRYELITGDKSGKLMVWR